MAVVPVEAFCTKEAAVTAALKVVVPVEVKAIAANLLVPPTIPAKVSLPEPEVMVKAYGVVEALSSVELNETPPLAEPLTFELRLMLPARIAGPVKLCRPLEKIFPLSVILLDELAVTLVTAVP